MGVLDVPVTVNSHPVIQFASPSATTSVISSPDTPGRCDGTGDVSLHPTNPVLVFHSSPYRQATCITEETCTARGRSSTPGSQVFWDPASERQFFNARQKQFLSCQHRGVQTLSRIAVPNSLSWPAAIT